MFLVLAQSDKLLFKTTRPLLNILLCFSIDPNVFNNVQTLRNLSFNFKVVACLIRSPVTISQRVRQEVCDRAVTYRNVT